MSELYSDSIFWIETDKIRPNPYQPRREFDDKKLEDLGDSIRQYGVLQPLVVTRHEIPKPDGGLIVEYELIAGERRLRASKLAGVQQVPAVIRSGQDNDKMKLELAIIENIQREDLNAVDRAKAFQRFVDEFDFKHSEIAKRVGKSREYVSNTLRLLSLPDDILDALTQGSISEGHTRPLMMLNDRKEQQGTLFKEIILKKMPVREAEKIARRIARDKVRKQSRDFNPEILQMEEELTEKFGTRVRIEAKQVGGKILIDFFDDKDLIKLLNYMKSTQVEEMAGGNVTPQESAPSVEKIEEALNGPVESRDEVVADQPTQERETVQQDQVQKGDTASDDIQYDERSEIVPTDDGGVDVQTTETVMHPVTDGVRMVKSQHVDHVEPEALQYQVEQAEKTYHHESVETVGVPSYGDETTTRQQGGHTEPQEPDSQPQTQETNETVDSDDSLYSVKNFNV